MCKMQGLFQGKNDMEKAFGSYTIACEIDFKDEILRHLERFPIEYH